MTRSGLLTLVLAWSISDQFCNEQPTAPNVPPTAAFIFNPVSPVYAGQTTVTFNATGSADRDGTIGTYIWDFGDGSPGTLGPIVMHVFPDTEATCTLIVYAVLLTVVDTQGAQGSIPHTVTVTELPDPRSPECIPTPTPRPWKAAAAPLQAAPISVRAARSSFG